MKVFIGILLLLILILLVPIIVVFEANPKLSVQVKYFGFKKALFLNEKDDKIKAQKTPKKGPAKRKKEKKKRETTFTKTDLWRWYQRLRHRVSPTVRRLLRRTSVGKFRLRIVVVGNDAADTAIRFGKINQRVFFIVALIDRIMTLKTEQIDIIPGFGEEKKETTCSGVIKLIPIVLLITASQLGFWGLLAAFPMLRTRSKGKSTNQTKAQDMLIAKDGKEEKNGQETPA